VTKGPGASDNLYFHFSNFTADNHFLIFVSNRGGAWQIFRAEVETGRVVQLTDLAATGAHTACPDPTSARRLHYLRGPEILALDLIDLTERKIGEIPKPYVGGFVQPTLSGDGKWMTLAKQRDPANWEIGLMDTQNGAYRTVVTEGFRIGHVQHCPTDPTIFYVWETGGYAPQRTWLVNDDGTANRPFYARTDPKAWFTPLKEWITRMPLWRRQDDPAPGLELPQERAAGHVFEPAGMVAPVPQSAQLLREPRPVPARMRLQTLLDLGQLFGTDTPSLDHLLEWFCLQQG
jgi:hypothetical protein